jgi:hypothetical protein
MVKPVDAVCALALKLIVSAKMKNKILGGANSGH